MRCPPTAPPAAPVAILVLAHLTSLCLGPCITTLSVSHFHFHASDMASTPGRSYTSPCSVYLAALTSLSASEMFSNCTGCSTGSHSPSAMFGASSSSTSAFGTSPAPDSEQLNVYVFFFHSYYYSELMFASVPLSLAGNNRRRPEPSLS